jgi:hypothetical protein
MLFTAVNGKQIPVGRHGLAVAVSFPWEPALTDAEGGLHDGFCGDLAILDPFCLLRENGSGQEWSGIETSKAVGQSLVRH